ncbi:trimethylamine methyltransferase family protein [Eubacterium barkeri]|uniref:Trimethylamine:corrinoid methyltransferase n=1 Tax=Eubacterium barkeri TaxID=1528 RepID=A0A1H3AT61_EUBBA|nr:trimethylamine methyltransferase family protein [Eubacterium barkeri]SDX32866.1 Trimethylamine:corrinoid methyltransferase [Eubacterium barkeri]
MSNFEFLSQETKLLIHKKALEILAETGVQIDSKEILEKLEGFGAEVDYENCQARFSKGMVEEAIKRCPSKFVLGGVQEEYDMYLGEGNTYVLTDTQGCFVSDLKTGERRNSTMKDLLDAARVTDAMDYIHCFAPIVIAGDVPEGSRTIREMVEIFKVSSKHVETDCFNEAQAKYYIEVLRKLFREDVLLERPPLSITCCPVSPLIFEAPMLTGTIAMGEINTPVLLLPMPISGTTAPMTLLGTIIQNTAEVLAGITILQSFTPGRKIIFGSADGIMDMKSLLCCVGSPEGALVNAANIEMGHFYNMPALGCNGTDAHKPNYQMGFERGSSNLPLFLAHGDMICGVGMGSSAMCLYLEELVNCEDVMNISRRIAQGIQDDEKLALAGVVKKVGPGGNFLNEKSTIKQLRNGEHYSPRNLIRRPYDKADPADMVEASKARVREILAAPPKKNFSDQIEQEVEEILKRADVECAEAAAEEE